MNISKRELADILYDAADFDASNEQAFDVIRELLAGTLEIEGYERRGWTKFDSGNPKTFPEHGSLVLMCRKDGVVCIGHFFDGDEKRSYWGHEVTHWQPLPKPPAETEV